MESKYDPTFPNHYRHGKIECWDYISDHDMNFLEGNVVKYITRWRYKNGLEDLKKARTYIDKLISDTIKNESKTDYNASEY